MLKLFTILPALLALTYVRIIYDPVLAPRTLLLSLAVLTLAGIAIFTKKSEQIGIEDGKIKVHRILVVILAAYTILTGLGIANAVNTQEAIFDFCKVLLLLPLFLIILQVLQSHDDARSKVLKGILIAGYIIQIIGLYQLISWLTDEETGRVTFGEITSSMGNKNLYSSIVLLMLPFGIISYRKLKATWKLAALIFITISVFNVLVMQARTVWLASIVAAFVLAILFLIVRKGKAFTLLGRMIKTSRRAIAIVAITAISGSVIFYLVKPDMLTNTYKQTIYLAENPDSKEARLGSVGNRLDLWEHTIAMFKDAPITGQGTGSWKFELPAYGNVGKKTMQGRMYYQRPHNDYLWAFAELGILGGLLFLAMIFIPIGLLIRSIRSRNDETKTDAYILLFGLLAFAIISFFSFPKERIMHQFMFVLYLAFAVTIYHRQKPDKVRVMGRKAFVALMGMSIISMGFVAAVSTFRLQGEYQTRQVLDHMAVGENDEMLEAANAAINPFYSVDPTSTPMLWYVGVAQHSSGNLRPALESFKLAGKYHPNHLLVLNNIASCYELLREQELAIEYYQRALEISPYFAESLCNLAILYRNAGEFDRAFETIEKCPQVVELPASYENYLFLILQSKLSYLKSAIKDPLKLQRFNALLENQTALIAVYRQCKNSNRDLDIYLLAEFG